jgi:TRAP-type C4-dicarboxylate transport system permease large subunit
LLGLLLREGATPLIHESDTSRGEVKNTRPNLVVHLLVPVCLVLGTAIGGYSLYDQVLIAEAFLIGTFYLAIVLVFQNKFKGWLNLPQSLWSEFKPSFQLSSSWHCPTV